MTLTYIFLPGAWVPANADTHADPLQTYLQIPFFLSGLRLDFLAFQSSHLKHATFLINYVVGFRFFRCYVCFPFFIRHQHYNYENMFSTVSFQNCFVPTRFEPFP